jgi:hypothetical protein
MLANFVLHFYILQGMDDLSWSKTGDKTTLSKTQLDQWWAIKEQAGCSRACYHREGLRNSSFFTLKLLQALKNKCPRKKKTLAAYNL